MSHIAPGVDEGLVGSAMEDAVAEKRYFEVEPYRIGVMIDLPESPGCSDLFVEGLRLGIDEARSQGICDRDVELIVREYASQPWKSAEANIKAYEELVAEGCIGIAGPMTTDNSMAVLPRLQELRVPAISICGSQLFVGEYAFATPNGGMADEPMIILSWMKAQGHKRIALIKETPSLIGEEYAENVRLAARLLGMTIVIEQGVSPLGNLDEPSFGPKEQIESALDAARAVAPDALLYFGLGHITAMMTQILKTSGWSIPRYTGAAFVGAAYSQDYVDKMDGWVGLDQWHHGQPVFDHLMALYEEKHGQRLEWPTSVFTCGYDQGRAFAVALDRMRIATGEALKNALETVTRLPAATGGGGTVLSFSKLNHRGLRGGNYLVVRESRGGSNNFLGYAPILA